MPNFVDQSIPAIPDDVSIVGHAIVCANGMIADETGNIPDALIIEADQRNFQAALDASALVVLGRKGHEKHPAKGRQRLVVSSSVDQLAQEPGSSNVHFWNPAGLAFPSVLVELGICAGNIAITGGQSVFELFLPHYTGFILAQVQDVRLHRGIACFDQGHPQNVLMNAGMIVDSTRVLEENVIETIWCAALA